MLKTNEEWDTHVQSCDLMFMCLTFQAMIFLRIASIIHICLPENRPACILTCPAGPALPSLVNLLPYEHILAHC